MKLFQRASVCKECGVHFEPVAGPESRWGDLCKTHRAPVMERDLRRDAVIAWAKANWEKIEPMALEESRAAEAANRERMNSILQGYASQQQTQTGGSIYGAGLSGLLGQAGVFTGKP